MAETVNFEIDGLRFEQMHPRELAKTTKQWLQIKDARKRDYTRVFKDRPREQIDYLVDSRTLQQFRNPNKARGSIALREQLRARPRVIAAFNERTNDLEGFAYGADNSSSDRKPWFPMGLAESAAKMYVPVGALREHRYFWGSEIVNPSERTGFEIVTAALLLDSAELDIRATWYRWREEADLKELLEDGGYEPDADVLGNVFTKRYERFGPGSSKVVQERWEAQRTGAVVTKLASLPGAANAIDQARSTMVS